MVDLDTVRALEPGERRRVAVDCSGLLLAEVEGRVLIDGALPPSIRSSALHGTIQLPGGRTRGVRTPLFDLREDGRFTASVFPGAHFLRVVRDVGGERRSYWSSHAPKSKKCETVRKTFDLSLSLAYLRLIDPDGERPIAEASVLVTTPDGTWGIQRLELDASGRAAAWVPTGAALEVFLMTDEASRRLPWSARWNPTPRSSRGEGLVRLRTLQSAPNRGMQEFHVAQELLVR